MWVRAVRMGFYEALRFPGEVFAVADGETASWFEPVADAQQPETTPDDELSVAQMRAKLDALGVKYSGRAGKATLAALLAEHE